MACIGILTRIGRSILPRLLGDSTKPHMLWVAWGTGETTATDSDVALGGEQFREAFVPTISGAKFTCVHLFTSAVTEAQDGLEWAEIGILDALVGGNLIWRGLLSTDGVIPQTKTLEEGDTLYTTIQFKIIQGTW